jgi:hypothetical protein
VENVNAQVDALIHTGVLRRLLAFTELKFSNSMIEAWWRSLKHQWLFLHSLDSIATVRRLVAFYVDEHNRVLPHSAFHGQTPDEMYFGTGDAMLAELASRASPRAERAFKPTDRRRARHARRSTRPRDHRSTTGTPRRVRPAAKPGEPGTARRTSRWAESPPVSSACRPNDENSRGKVQNVRGDSSVTRVARHGAARRQPNERTAR